MICNNPISYANDIELLTPFLLPAASESPLNLDAISVIEPISHGVNFRVALRTEALSFLLLVRCSPPLRRRGFFSGKGVG